MKEDRSDLMLFIDLGFILLVGFLVLSDTTPKENVPLPAGDEEEQPREPEEDRRVFEVLFTADLQFLVVAVREQSQVCAPVGMEAFTSCLSAVASSSAVFVLAPQGLATVQQLVSLLDVCHRNQWRCTVNS